MEQTTTANNYIEVKSALNWDEYFMLQAMIASFRSKDPSTKVGAVFVDKNNHQITMGYNGFVAGLDETKLPWGKNPDAPLEEQKYGYVVHAEANAIIHCKGNLEGTRAYVTLFPCNECAKLIASSKVREIVFLSDKHSDKSHTKIARKIFDLAGINYRKLEISEDLVSKLDDHLKGLLADL